MPDLVPVADPANTQVTIVGCGGTGTHLMPQLCRLLYGLKEQRLAGAANPPLFGKARPEDVPSVLLIDGDTVEPKNLLRQNFAFNDVGRKKAAVLVERYAAIFGLEISAYPRYLLPDTQLTNLIPHGAIVVGCVDNSKTRLLLHEKLSEYPDVVYLDAGNAAVAPAPPGLTTPREATLHTLETGWEGQVLCGARVEGKTTVPFPADVLPDLVSGDDHLPTEVPCGEVVVANPQRHATNLWAATTLTTHLNDLLTHGAIRHYKSFFCARRGYLKSYPAEAAIEETDAPLAAAS